MAIVNVEKATSEVTVFNADLPLGARQLDRLAEQLERRRAAGKRTEHDRRKERSLSRNSVLPGSRSCGG